MIQSGAAEKAYSFLFKKTDFDFFHRLWAISVSKMAELTWKPYGLVGF